MANPDTPLAGQSAPRRLAGKALLLSALGTVLMLGACGPDKPSGYTNYPDRWEYRQDPSDNNGRIYRY